MLIKICLYLKIDILIFLINKSKMCSSYSAKKKKKCSSYHLNSPKEKKNHTPIAHHRNPQKSSVNSTHCKENIPRV